MMWGKRVMRKSCWMSAAGVALLGALVVTASGTASSATPTQNPRLARPATERTVPAASKWAQEDGRPAPNLGGNGMNRSRILSTSTSNSLNWAGFAATGTIQTVTGSWTQPTVVCSGSKAQQSAFWIGIDGFAATDPTVQQIGTDADCTKASKGIPSTPVYYAWYQMYPQALVGLSPTTYPVVPGNVLSASVIRVGGSYVLSMSDLGHWTFAVTVAASTPPLNSSAEWIAEAPLSCSAGKCKPVPLANFGSIAFTGATVNGLTVNGAGLVDTRITMTKNKKGSAVKASTSALDLTGHAFGVTWLSN